VKLIRTLSYIRLGLVPLALAKVVLDLEDFPTSRYEAAAWLLVGAQALVALLLLVLAYRWHGRHRYLAVLNLVADAALVTGLMFVFAWEPGQPLRSLAFLVVLEAALFFGLVGGVVVGVLTLPVLTGLDLWREAQFDTPVRYDALVLRGVVAIALGGVVGRLVEMERSQSRAAEDRAAEAERFRDELGRRIDLLEATSRAARALGSSLDLDAAFAAFVQELRGLLAFDRAAILLVEPAGSRIMATAGVGADDILAPGASIGVPESLLEKVIGEGRTIYREDIAEDRHPEEADLRLLGVRSRVLAPLQLGARSIGALALSRTEPNSFRAEEIDLVTLLGRLVATAVQNLRTYEAERASADELRRLSSLRADFVSLVSHELRSPMAAVIGSAQTLQHRWRELKPEQRDAFLAVIGDETSRLSDLVGDVLDTSRIEAGTFGYAFSDVDLAAVIRDSVAAAQFGQDDVRLATSLPATLPSLRGDGERLRQLVDNLISNAIKYSDAGGEVAVEAEAEDGHVTVRVRDRGPGILPEHHDHIFEKFGRAAGSAKPGTGLGLFLSRSFAEAHGGSLAVESRPGEGAIFTLTLPLS
jgi:signal transduction histidine kinase